MCDLNTKKVSNCVKCLIDLLLTSCITWYSHGENHCLNSFSKKMNIHVNEVNFLPLALNSLVFLAFNISSFSTFNWMCICVAAGQIGCHIVFK